MFRRVANHSLSKWRKSNKEWKHFVKFETINVELPYSLCPWKKYLWLCALDGSLKLSGKNLVHSRYFQTTANIYMQTSTSLNDFFTVTVACVLERILGTMLNSGAWDLGRTLLQRWNSNYGELIIACNVAEGDKLNYKNKSLRRARRWGLPH